MSESNHPWCRDTARDEAIRDAEDAAAVPSIQHRDLPEQVALVWASLGDLLGRVVRLEGEFDAGQDEEAAPAEGMRKERCESVRVVEEADAASDEAVAHGATLSALAAARESLAAANRGIARLTAEAMQQSDAWDGARQAYSEGLAKVKAERDAAIRERDEAREECERLGATVAIMERRYLRCVDLRDADGDTIATLKARVAELEGDRRPATWQEEEAAVEGAWLLCGLEPDWPSDEPGTIVRHAESMRREVGRLRDRVAELEAAAKLAPAANAGGEDAVVVPQTVVAGNFAQIHWNTCCRLHRMAMDKAGVRWTQSTEPSRPESEEAENAGGEQEPVAWGVLMPNQDVRTVCLFRNTEEKAKENFPPSEGWTHFPLYAAPLPPRSDCPRTVPAGGTGGR